MNKIIAISLSCVTILFGSMTFIKAQLNEESALMAKRFLALHGTFRTGQDLTRPDFKALVSKVSGVIPRLYDSIEYKKLFLVSKNRAYSPKTGLTIEPFGRLVRIVSLHPNSIAAKAGLSTNDMIRSINGVYPMHINHAWELLEEKSSCSIEALRGNTIRKHVFVSSFYPMNRIHYMINEDVLTIKVFALDEALLSELFTFETQLRSKAINAIELDIRNIIGIGELKTVLNVADEFIDDETEVMTLNAGDISYVHTSVAGGRFVGIPLKVKIDSTVQGYGLILAGLLASFADAELIGSPTSTDGLLQSFIKIQDSPVMYLAIPYANYEIEQCPPLDGRGLSPGKLNEEHIVAK